MSFEPVRPGVWLREDLADVLTALSQGTSAGLHAGESVEYDRGRASALVDVAIALGLRWRDTVNVRAWHDNAMTSLVAQPGSFGATLHPFRE